MGISFSVPSTCKVRHSLDTHFNKPRPPYHALKIANYYGDQHKRSHLDCVNKYDPEVGGEGVIFNLTLYETSVAAAL